jgi:CRISPR-associated protein Cas4
VGEWGRSLSQSVVGVMRQAFAVDQGLLVLAFTLVFVAIVVDALIGHIQRTRRATGITRKMVVKAVDGGKFALEREYVSSSLGLAGRPDAIVVENGIHIPIERKSFGKKPRDKDIAQLLVYLRLVEEAEGVRPPHGYIILGPQAKRFKVLNTPEKQAWLEDILKEMRAAIAGQGCKATPHPRKCSGCALRMSCEFKAGGQ